MPAPLNYSKNTPGGSVTAFNWSRTCAVGNTLVMEVHRTGTVTCTVADNGSNPWVKVASSLDATTPAVSGRVVDFWMCVPTVAITNVTVTGSGAAFWVLQAAEFAGQMTLRSSAKWYGAAGAQAGVPAVINDTVITGCVYPATTAGTDEATVSGWTQLGFNNVSTATADMFYRIAPSTGTLTPSFTVSKTIGAVTMAMAVIGPNVVPTITPGAAVTLSSGSSTTVGFAADDTDGTISSFTTPTVTSTADTAPTVGTPTYSGLGTSHATVSYPITGLTNSDTTVTTKAVDNNGGQSDPASVRVIYTSTAPRAKAVTLVAATMTSPSSGTPKDAWNAWLANPYDATTNPTGLQPPAFTTDAPPASNASVTVDYQPLDAASLPPSFSQSWGLTPDASTPATVYVDLRFSGVTKATAQLTLNSTTPVPVGRVCTDTENTAIGAGQLSRVAPSVVGRFA